MMRTDAQNWGKLWKDLGADADGRATHAQLISAYFRPARRYHNLQHISECLLELDKARPLVGSAAELEAAIWFHDAVYDPHSSANEEESAGLAVRHLAEAHVDAARVEHVRELIMVTKTHEPGVVADAAVLVDIDLAILGQPATRFWEYEHAIRAEYAFVPEESFAAARAEILTRFLQRPRLYRTEHFSRRYETIARANLATAIARLRALLP